MVVNLTPHDITLIREDGSTVVFPAHDKCARVSEVWTDRSPIAVSTDGDDWFDVPVGHRSLGSIEGLWDPQIDTYYIVSSIVAQKAWQDGRGDVIVPADFVRDDGGRIIGCRKFEVIR